MEIDENDIKWLKKWYPELDEIEKKEDHYIIKGLFKFKAGYNPKKKRYKILDDGQPVPKGTVVIEDCYKIRMKFGEGVNFFREVEEIGGKIEETAREKGISDLHDLHYSRENNKVCLAGYLDENLNIPFWAFIDGVVLQFFYDQTFFRKYNKWPRSFYAHGILGLLENFYSQSKNTTCDNLTQTCLTELVVNIKNNKKELKVIKGWKKKLSEEGLELDSISQQNFKIRENNAETNRRILNRTIKYLKKKKNNNGWNCISCLGQRFLDCHPKAFYGLKVLKKSMKKKKLKL